jgi:hypothetical protein
VAMLVSEFNQGSPPPLPDSLGENDRVDQYIMNLVAHAYYTAIKIDQEEHGGKRRQQRMFNFEIGTFPDMTFSIRIPTRHRYRLENRGLPETQSTTIDNNYIVDNNSLVAN